MAFQQSPEFPYFCDKGCKIMVSNIEYVFSDSTDIIDVLIESIDEYFFKDVFSDIDLEHTLSEYLDELRDDLYFLVEFPYVDKVYRNSYYHYYASKHSAYQRDCIRVSIFGAKVGADDFWDPRCHQQLQEHFLGYFVLRPIRAIFGRSLIKPSAFEQRDFHICREKAISLIFGVKLECTGFPHSSQDGETISCAETTVWALMEYFGNRYAEYKPVLPSQILKVMEQHATQRQLPSGGLTMDEISYVLKQYGFGPRLYSEQRYSDPLPEIVDAYIESGIPLMVGLESQTGGLGHVVVLIGKQYSKPDFSKTVTRNVSGFGRQVAYYDAADFASKYVIQDDNLPPYRLVPLSEPGMHYLDADSKSYQIDHVVVPLYPKIYLEAFVAKQLIIEILLDSLLGYNFDDHFVLRVFLASSRSFKSYIAGLPFTDADFKNNVLLAKMPKFIWIAEIYEPGRFDYHNSEASGLIVLDATEANQTSVDTLIFAAYPDRLVSIEENKFVHLQHKFRNYRFYSNLA